jgi:hypothetical protein
MPFRFQRRIRVAPGVRLNLSKSGLGGSIGRNGLRLGIDAKGRKYFSIGLPGTGLSYRGFIDRFNRDALLIVGIVVLAVICLAVMIIVGTR